MSGLIGQLHSKSEAWTEKSLAQSWYEIPVSVVHLNPTATLLERTLLTQGFMGTSKTAFHRRLRPQNRDST